MSKVTERIPFKLIEMPCCNTLIYHVNHWWPMYCSGCGERVYPHVKGCSLVSDDNATLSYEDETK